MKRATATLELWGPGRELNGRRQPFQGCSHPKLSVDSARHSSEFLPDFALLIGAKMEPSCTNLSLPRFASIRHGFEVPANPNRILAGSFDNRFLGDSCCRRERALRDWTTL